VSFWPRATASCSNTIFTTAVLRGRKLARRACVALLALGGRLDRSRERAALSVF